MGDFASFVSAGEKPFSGNGNRDGRRLGLNVGLVDKQFMLSRPFGWQVDGTGNTHAVREATSYRRNFPQTMPRTEVMSELPLAESGKPFDPTPAMIVRLGGKSGIGLTAIQSRYCVVASI